ncbi:MRP family ATP-binding protein [Paenibacillus psychroresistens]|uniref:Iron-sulfur cluster carrier protein n=1 Tax=Paenibacillus psychroresistens TaxID=1778678 RepID=A0A6B8R9X2_9BACL|nr:Mrp/NBP35 family ATP-binding protein [Paenibacillus psychroresistens]QGQ93651.1 MRP family ATP-binding protein [Paenibacillus psychroresistens]
MITKEQILEAVKHVYDPEFKKPLVELNFVRDVLIKDEKVALTIVLSNDEELLKSQYKQDITGAIKHLGYQGEVHIRFRAISEHEKSELSGGDQKQQTRPQSKIRTDESTSILSPEANVRFIAVASGKGGVGKSTVTVNLAVALARKGKKVGIIDADIYGFSIPDMMGIENRPEMVENKIIPIERFGVKVISMGFFVEDNAPIIWRGPMLGKMLRNFFAEVTWGELDYVLLDLPPGTGDVALDVHQMIPQSKEIVVTTPHATAAFVAARAGAMALQTNHEILGVIENMSYYLDKSGEKDYVFGRGGGGKLAEQLNTELLAQIPLGAPDNLPTEEEYAPSVYKADTPTGLIYLEIADGIIAKLG